MSLKIETAFAGINPFHELGRRSGNKRNRAPMPDCLGTDPLSLLSTAILIKILHSNFFKKDD